MRGRFNLTEILPTDILLLKTIDLEIPEEEVMEDQGLLLLDTDLLKIAEIILRGLIGRMSTEDQELQKLTRKVCNS